MNGGKGVFLPAKPVLLERSTPKIFLFPLSSILVEPLNITKKGPNHTKKGKHGGQLSQFRYDHHKKGKTADSDG